MSSVKLKFNVATLRPHLEGLEARAAPRAQCGPFLRPEPARATGTLPASHNCMA